MTRTSKHQKKIGVMGSASGPTLENPDSRARATELGREIARQDAILINGACPGLPDLAAAGAKEEGGFVFGVSPAFSLAEHVEVYDSPTENYDMILYSGMGLMERDIVNIRSSDGVIVVGGGVGTLNEFTVAYEERKPVGVLAGSGGISDHIEEILAFANREAGPDRIIFDADPVRLVRRLVETIDRVAPPRLESEIGGVAEAKEPDSGSQVAEAKYRQQMQKRDAGKLPSK